MHDIELALKIILDGPPPTLWDRETKRETLRFMRKRGGDIPRQGLSRLVKEIIKGPIREGYYLDAPDEEWQRYQNHHVLLRLHKLIEGGANLPKKALAKYKLIQKAQPWEPSVNRSEEFSLFVSSGWVDKDEIGTSSATEDFASMETEKFVEWANFQHDQKSDRPWDCSQYWATFFEIEPTTAIRLLKEASLEGCWSAPVWYVALSRFDKAKKTTIRTEREVSALLLEMPSGNMAPIALTAAKWLEHSRKYLQKRKRQKLWLQIWDASIIGEELSDESLGFEATLNHSGGVLGNILYSEMTEYVPKVGPDDAPGIPIQLRESFERLADANHLTARLARLRMAPMLWALYRIAPEWTIQTMFRRMDIEETETFDPHLWESFFWHPTWTDDLFTGFRDVFFKVMTNLRQLEELISDRVSENAPQLFIHLAIPPDRNVSTDEARGILSSMNSDQLANAAWALKQIIQGAGDKSPMLWNDTLAPWFERAWPKRNDLQSALLSEKLAWMAIDSGDAFPFVVDAIKGRIGVEEHSSALYHLLSSENEKDQDEGLISRFPKSALVLVEKLVGDKDTFGDTLQETLETIKKADRRVANSNAFRRLEALI